MHTLKPQDKYGDYRLVKRLGFGGMAEVWLAQPLGTWHRYPYVVLKRVHAHLSEEPRLRRMFLDEAHLAERLNHPNVVRVFDVGQLEDELFMTMELIDGLDLRSALDLNAGPLLPALAVAFIVDACAGLHYAHTLKSLDGKPLNIVHRDIAPDNLMVDVEGRVRLVDFGVARADTNEVTTQTGLRKGKARYMAPEYLTDHECSAKSDVYAMGATLFELVTGQKPYGDLTAPPQVFQAIVKHGLPRADTVRPSVPPALVRIIADATERAPRRRLPSAKALEERLRDFLTEFRPPSRADVGREVALWQKKKGDVLKVPKRVAGSFGQLESTEYVQVAAQDVTPKEGAPFGGPPTVEVAHQLDSTGFAVPAFPDDVTDPSMPPPVDPGEGPTGPIDVHSGSVILTPELEAMATRTPARRRRKKKR